MMNPTDQEKLFKRVQKRFPKWSIRMCSGYVHGIIDEAQRPKPDILTIRNAMNRSGYAIGYLRGFIDARGNDIMVYTWAQHACVKLVFEWWKK